MSLEKMSTSDLAITTIRTLAMDAVQKANSGHPGAPMALAPLAYVLWQEVMHYNPHNPHWLNRDRFVLSNGHASILQYAMLYLTGYDLSLDELKNFRQWGSKTPGHPEHHLTPGVETTTGPLGQGFANAVGMALAEAHLAAVYNREGFDIIDHYTYVIAGDGCFMEGLSHEAASLAGHLGLSKLICFYDDNHITIEGRTELTYSDNVAQRFESYGWQVQNIGEKANDIQAISAAIAAAKKERSRPSLIIIRSHIAYGAPNLQDTSEAHGAPLGEEEVQLTKKAYGWPESETFLVPEKVLSHMRQAIPSGERLEQNWHATFLAYQEAFPELAAQLRGALALDLPKDWDSTIPTISPVDGAQATRNVSGKVLNAIAAKVPFLIGGSADLSPSTKTLIKGTDYISKGQCYHRNIAWGVREFAMCACASGLALHGGVQPYTATFFVFTDYARPAIRLASLMKLPVIYIMTHDSIGVGEDGPTHQPIEHIATFRVMPNLCLIRPGDANETAYAWRAAMLRREGPTMLVLTRQNLPVFDQEKLGSAAGVLRGAYILSKEKGSKPDIILMGTGSEVQLVLSAQAKLAERGVDARVVSMPSWELFREQDVHYQSQVLPEKVKARLAVEAASPMGWHEWIGEAGDVMAIDQYGASAPAKRVFEEYGFTVDAVVARAGSLV